jgi:hypothetical protein
LQKLRQPRRRNQIRDYFESLYWRGEARGKRQ